MKRTIFILFSVLFLASCSLLERKKDSSALIEVAGQFLYESDVRQVIPTGVSAADSARIADRFIQRWVTDVLMYDYAKRNISNTATINELVEDYRRSLFVHAYEQKLINQRLPNSVSEDTLKAVYERMSDVFPLRENLIRGMLFIFPKEVSDWHQIKKWLQESDEQAIEKIEKYVFKNATGYEFFQDKWTPFTKVAILMPLQIQNPQQFLRNHTIVEATDSTSLYVLHINDYRLIGDDMPYEYARPEVENLLLNMQKNTFIQSLETELYDDAVRTGKVVFYKKSDITTLPANEK